MESKKCSSCGEQKPILDFSRNKTTKDGHSYDCRNCHTEANRRWREKNKDSVMRSRRKAQEHRVKTGQKSAQNKLMWAMEKGTVKKQNCAVCGGKAEAHHHFGYDHPTEVVWRQRCCKIS